MAFQVLTVEILEVGQLDALPHAQNVGGGAEAVEHHPEVTRVQGGHGSTGGSVLDLAIAAQRMLDIRPSGNDGAHDHQAEGEESHMCDGASEPKHLSIGDQDDCQVLEDGVDGDREELEGPGARVDHADEEERDGEPWCCQSGFFGREAFCIHFFASSLLKSR
jgi:hypothetical protein